MRKIGYLQSLGWQTTLLVGPAARSGDLESIEKSMVRHDTECSYWGQVSLIKANTNLAVSYFLIAGRPGRD